MTSNPPEAQLDTPRFSHCPSGGKAEDIKAYMKGQLDIMRCELEADTFLAKFLPFPSAQADLIFETLKEDRVYEASRWKEIPLEATSLLPETADTGDGSSTSRSRSLSPGNKRKREEPFYDPFVKILNKIAQESVEVAAGQGSARLGGKWVNTHNKAPKTTNPDSNILLPDVSYTYVKNAEEMKDHWVPRKDAHRGDSTEKDKKVESRLWLQIYTVVEIKPKKDSSVLSQLATYVRQIFMEQLDRYFVLAFTFELDTLRIHLFDRSGVISSTPINIHQSPKQFISAVASWSYLSPDQLGWDPTVRVWSHCEVVKSYMARLDEFGSAHDVPWVIEGFDTTAQVPDGVADDGHIPLFSGMPSATGQTLRATENLSEHRRHTAQDKVTWKEKEGGGDAMAVDSSSGGGVADEDVHQPAPLVSDRPGISNGKSYWVAIRSITLQDAKRLWGRGTIVLEVVSLKDWEERNSKANRYVLKQSWQRLPGLESDGASIALTNTSHLNNFPESREENPMLKQQLSTEPFEAVVLSRAGLAERVTEAGFVRVNGETVDTGTYIRKEIKLDTVGTIKSRRKSKKQSQVRTKPQTTTPHTTGSRIRETIGSASSSVSVPNVQEALVESSSVPVLGAQQASGGSSVSVMGAHQAFVNRTLVRIIFNIRGVTIREFANKKELLMGFKGALEEHEKCYRKGIIQRDISTGNIIINDGRGHLIDFDHSKITDKLEPLKQQDGFEMPEDRRQYHYAKFEKQIVHFVEDVLGAPRLANFYLFDLKDYYSALQGSQPTLLSFDALGWSEKPYDVPLFASRQVGPGYVTGTPPFMSNWLYRNQSRPHTAIHDIECCLWVFDYLSLKYDGPGQAIRTMSPELKAYFEELFAGNELSHKLKRRILEDRSVLEQHLTRVSPYFDDLKDLIREWWGVLELAYKYPAGMEYNYPHQAVLRCIDRALARINTSTYPQSHHDLEEKAAHERRKYTENIQQAILQQKTFDALTKLGNSTATSSTVPVQNEASSSPTTPTSNSTALSETSPARKKNKQD
ncbi:hypothetical protein NP233_g11023 [Leucocoprinus birnbaumii]|uniref:Fungal-type protein kinase domain-containing protein n=1 Tax=Leucocoprinus birnbaumii TaxID=56174 RepID=A0AAD5VN72_9AGAR|nr:hypothetical protein NP233_g11023 [Leucocoprinus birnbaumii]